MSERIGVRELRDGLSGVLRRVRAGESVTVTDRDRPIALIVPVREGSVADRLAAQVGSGRLSWKGGKPRGAARPPVVQGPAVADAVVEDRR
jgi:prevent-host-death family protein